MNKRLAIILETVTEIVTEGSLGAKRTERVISSLQKDIRDETESGDRLQKTIDSLEGADRTTDPQGRNIRTLRSAAEHSRETVNKLKGRVAALRVKSGKRAEARTAKKKK